MRIDERSGGKLLVSELLDGVPGLVAGVSTRALGSIPGDGGAPGLGAALGWAGPPPRFLRQVHGAAVLDASPPPPPGAEGDGLLAVGAGALVGVRVADCLPVVVAPRGGGAVAVLHAGWRGLAGGLIETGVGRLAEATGTAPEGLVAALGPAIGFCCFEVGPEVAAAVSPRASRIRLGTGDRLFIDLRGVAADRLVDAGLPGAAIDAEAPCTRCREDLCHSYRRDGAEAGRMAAVAGYASSSV